MNTIDLDLLAVALGPLPEEFVWQPWGYELPELDPEPESLLDLRPDDTQFLSVRDFVLANEFPLTAAAVA